MVTNYRMEVKRISFMTRAVYLAELFTYPLYYVVLSYFAEWSYVSGDRLYDSALTVVVTVLVFIISLAGAYFSYHVFTNRSLYKGRLAGRMNFDYMDEKRVAPNSIFALYVISISVIQFSSLILFTFSFIKQNVYYYHFFILPSLFFFLISYPRISKVEELMSKEGGAGD
ncbi:MAG: hypothetical protein PF637_10770 [Spirochaetes bacterium]|jgi:hypothetical protein|nr:hypothetical protein [Spirochaetota bacterium]